MVVITVGRKRGVGLGDRSIAISSKNDLKEMRKSEDFMVNLIENQKEKTRWKIQEINILPNDNQLIIRYALNFKQMMKKWLFTFNFTIYNDRILIFWSI